MSLRCACWAMYRQADWFLQTLGVPSGQFVLVSLLAESDLASLLDRLKGVSDAMTLQQRKPVDGTGVFLVEK